MKFTLTEQMVLKVILKKLIGAIIDNCGTDFVYEFPQDHLDYVNDLIKDHNVTLTKTDTGVRITKN